jgi:hypothetical protein
MGRDAPLCQHRGCSWSGQRSPRLFLRCWSILWLASLPEAEKSALKAVEVDKTKRELRAHFLLVQIYEIEGKPDAEAAQLQEYLKSATDPRDVTMVKKYLADLAASHRK